MRSRPTSTMRCARGRAAPFSSRCGATLAASGRPGGRTQGCLLSLVAMTPCCLPSACAQRRCPITTHFPSGALESSSPGRLLPAPARSLALPLSSLLVPYLLCHADLRDTHLALLVCLCSLSVYITTVWGHVWPSRRLATVKMYVPMLHHQVPVLDARC